MKFWGWFKYCWWVILLGLCGYLLFCRYDGILSGDVKPFDAILIASFALLAFLPFFTEMSLLGFTLKKDMTDFKNQIKDEVRDIKNTISNSIAVNNGFTPQIYLGQNAAPSDDQLGDLEHRIKEILHSAMDEKMSHEKSLSNSFDIDENTKLLIFARYQLEKEVKRLWLNRFEGHIERNTFSFGTMIRDLIGSEYISKDLGSVLREAYSVCSSAIHGENPTDNQVKFVKDVMPSLVQTLKQMPRSYY